jgi:hypothetical protein
MLEAEAMDDPQEVGGMSSSDQMWKILLATSSSCAGVAVIFLGSMLSVAPSAMTLNTETSLLVFGTTLPIAILSFVLSFARRNPRFTTILAVFILATTFVGIANIVIFFNPFGWIAVDTSALVCWLILVFVLRREIRSFIGMKEPSKTSEDAKRPVNPA